MDFRANTMRPHPLIFSSSSASLSTFSGANEFCMIISIIRRTAKIFLIVNKRVNNLNY